MDSACTLGPPPFLMLHGAARGRRRERSGKGKEAGEERYVWRALAVVAGEWGFDRERRRDGGLIALRALVEAN